MDSEQSPYHAHLYYTREQRPAALRLQQSLVAQVASGAADGLLFVGELRDGKVGPHCVPQFEIHFLKRALPAIIPIIEAAGLTALVHPLTDDDQADHTRLARWIGTPLKLDLTTLDPPGVNQGLARFAKSDR